jgi:hypothetical protein
VTVRAMLKDIGDKCCHLGVGGHDLGVGEHDVSAPSERNSHGM